MTNQVHPIGEVSRRTGVSVSAIRYYDDEGLIDKLIRSGGKRLFGLDAIRRVSFVRRAREVGFSIGEIRAVLNEGPAEWASIVERKRRDLIEKRAELDTMIELLGEISECGCQAIADCDLIDYPTL